VCVECDLYAFSYTADHHSFCKTCISCLVITHVLCDAIHSVYAVINRRYMATVASWLQISMLVRSSVKTH